MRINDDKGQPIVDTRADYQGPTHLRADYDTQELHVVSDGKLGSLRRGVVRAWRSIQASDYLMAAFGLTLLMLIFVIYTLVH